MVILVKPVQSENAITLIHFTPLGMVILVKPVQSPNAYSPIIVTLSGMVILVKLVQPANAYSRILVTLLGIITLVKLVQFKNASYILTTGYPSISDGMISSPVIDLSQPVIVTSPFIIS